MLRINFGNPLAEESEAAAAVPAVLVDSVDSVASWGAGSGGREERCRDRGWDWEVGTVEVRVDAVAVGMFILLIFGRRGPMGGMNGMNGMRCGGADRRCGIVCGRAQ